MTVAKPPIAKDRFVSRINKLCREAWNTVHDNWNVHTGTQDPKPSERERVEEAVRLSLLAGIDSCP
jgi:hypothetical protein